MIGNVGGGAKAPSLQESFKRFRKQKVKERRIMQMCKEELTTKGPRTQEFKDKLRMKFVDQAKKYLGVPYSEKYKKPEDPVAPLYLDCCGLVRKVVQDLGEEFGFLIGRWNQAYQMDTLPIRKAGVHELKPGDLIFYTGKYSSPRSKPQKHDNVHVEIFLGGETGEATIGARYFRGKVSIFDSYKFSCNTWSADQHHFCSIETWLDGKCESHCSEHPWLIDSGLMLAAAAGKKSIFNEDSDDESAGGYFEDDEDMESHIQKQSSAASKKVVSKVDTGVNAKNSGETYSVSNNSAKPADSAEYIPPKGNGITGPPNTYYVAKANGWRLVKAAMDNMGWQQLPFEYQFSSRFGLKWVERRSQIDYRSHQPGQLVCHIPNNEVITTKIGLLSALRHKFCRVPVGSVERKPTPWLPETYQLDIPVDVNAALEVDQTILSTTGVAPIWIYKPSCNNRGRGIKVISGHDELRQICVGKPASSKDADDAVKASEGVVQRYLENPLLVPHESGAFKFDYRCYLLVARNDPTYMCFYHPGYCRLTMKPYSADRSTLSDPIVHLTNASLQKKDPNYKENKDFQVQSLENVAQRLEDSGDCKNAEYLRREMPEQVKKCMADILRASSSKFMKKQGFFDLFGIDFMVTSDQKTYLLEANTNPALSLDNDYLRNTLPEMVEGCLSLVVGLQGPDRPRKEDRQNAADEEVLKSIPGNWELLHDEKRKFWYKAKAISSS
eukprot:GSChrysophyteH1.ASY1.ANO1.602.1 assembled CDS